MRDYVSTAYYAAYALTLRNFGIWMTFRRSIGPQERSFAQARSGSMARLKATLVGVDSI